MLLIEYKVVENNHIISAWISGYRLDWNNCIIVVMLLIECKVVENNHILSAWISGYRLDWNNCIKLLCY